MNSIERKELRRERRQAERNNKLSNFKTANGYDDFNEVFSLEHLYESYKKCCRNVRWKSSTVFYEQHALSNIIKTYEELHEGIWKPSRFKHFYIFERGKKRHIQSVKIYERVVQRCLCDYCLVPMIEHSLIYENCATLKDKGVTFSRKLIRKHLNRMFKKHGQDFYALTFDYSKYFESIPHSHLKNIIRKCLTDQKLIALCDQLIDMNTGDCGIGLGSQISQILAVAAANKLDHYVKEVLSVKEYQRYNDDGYLLHHSKEFLKYALSEIHRISEELGLHLNTKKTQIKKITQGFIFLKGRYRIHETGKIIVKPAKCVGKRGRRRIKKLEMKRRAGERTYENNYESYFAYRQNLVKYFNSHNMVKNMDKYYKKWTYTPPDPMLLAMSIPKEFKKYWKINDKKAPWALKEQKPISFWETLKTYE